MHIGLLWTALDRSNSQEVEIFVALVITRENWILFSREAKGTWMSIKSGGITVVTSWLIGSYSQLKLKLILNLSVKWEKNKIINTDSYIFMNNPEIELYRWCFLKLNRYFVLLTLYTQYNWPAVWLSKQWCQSYIKPDRNSNVKCSLEVY